MHTQAPSPREPIGKIIASSRLNKIEISYFEVFEAYPLFDRAIVVWMVHLLAREKKYFICMVA